MVGMLFSSMCKIVIDMQHFAIYIQAFPNVEAKCCLYFYKITFPAHD